MIVRRPARPECLYRGIHPSNTFWGDMEIDEPEFSWHYTDDLGRLAIDHGLPSDERAIASEASLPIR